MKKTILILILFTCSNALFSMVDRSTYYSYGTQFYVETLTVPDISKDSIHVYVMYNIMYDALAFKKKINDLSRVYYSASPKIEITFKDDTGIIRNRAFKIDSIDIDEYKRTSSKSDFHLGILSTKLPKNDFEAKFNIYENKSSLYEKDIDIEGKSIETDNYISEPIFVYSNFKNDNRLIPMAAGNDMFFNRTNSKLLFLYTYDDLYDINFSIKKVTDNEKGYWQNEFSFSARAEIVKSANIAINNNHLEIEKFISPFINEFAVLQIELPEEQMTPGKYTLKLDNNHGFIHETDFEVQWSNMPLSLENPDYAVDMMYYILNDEEYELIDKGNEEEKINKIADYWQSKDPTPETPFNEAMVEYFERVDYAYFNFQTIQESDGAKTQRGKIYILYGKPTEINTELISNNAREIWTYEKVKKQFIFENTAPGVYELAEIKEL